MNPHEGPLPNDPLGDMMRTWAGMASAAMPRPEARAPFAAAAGAAPGAAHPASNVLAQAHWLATGVSMRVWTRAAQSLVRYQQESGTADAPAAAEGPARQADAARAHLRRLGEIALEEARSLDAQLQSLGEQLRASMEDPAAAKPPQRRYARAKP